MWGDADRLRKSEGPGTVSTVSDSTQVVHEDCLGELQKFKFGTSVAGKQVAWVKVMLWGRATPISTPGRERDARYRAPSAGKASSEAAL